MFSIILCIFCNMGEDLEKRHKSAKMTLYCSPEYQITFKSVGLSVQEKKLKMDFQDDGCGCHLEFWIRTFLAILYLQITTILPARSEVSWPFGLQVQEKFKIDLQDGSHLGFLTEMILTISDLQVALIPPTKFCHLAFPFSSSKYIFKMATIFDFQSEKF